QPRARERLRALGPAGLEPLAMLLHVGVAGAGQAVDDRLRRGATLRLAVGADRAEHAVTELRIEVALEEVGRLHDVHVRVHEPESIFHRTLLTCVDEPFRRVDEPSRISCRPRNERRDTARAPAQDRSARRRAPAARRAPWPARWRLPAARAPLRRRGPARPDRPW